jgi:hypothetical protein
MPKQLQMRSQLEAAKIRLLALPVCPSACNNSRTAELILMKYVTGESY